MRFFLIISLFIFCSKAIAQDPTEQEKAILQVINNFKIDPQAFLRNKVMPYIDENGLKSNRYARSLIREMRDLEPMPALSIDSSLQEMAKEFAVKSGNRGWFGHNNYKRRFDQYGKHLTHDAENIQYGIKDPAEIVIDLLIDQDVPSLGHRKNLLDPQYTVIGIGFAKHKDYGYLTVMALGGF